MRKIESESEEKRKKRLSDWPEAILEFEDHHKKDFDNPKLQLRRLFSEMLGTFFLVLVAVGGNTLRKE